MTQATPPLPSGAPKAGEVYRHYKGDLYRVVNMALSSADEWTVVYEAVYVDPAAALFTRPLAEWGEVVEWQGSKVERFIKQK